MVVSGLVLNKTGNKPNYASETPKQDWKQQDWKQNYASETGLETKKTMPLEQDRKQEDWKQNKLCLSNKNGNKQKYASETRQETTRLEIK